MQVLLSYNGLTMNKTEWSKYLGISHKSFNERYKKYWPYQPEKVFSEYYLNSSVKEPMIVHREMVKDSLKNQAARINLLKKIKTKKEMIEDLQKSLIQDKECLKNIR